MVAPYGNVMDRATVRQKKTGRPVKFEITEQTRLAVEDYLETTQKRLANSCLAVTAVKGVALQHVNMRVWYRVGSLVSGWNHRCSAHTHYAGPRQR